jgi:hypothetical protein
MCAKNTGYEMLIAVFIALGSTSFEYSLASLSNFLAKPDFFAYFDVTTMGPRAHWSNNTIGTL